MPYSPRAESLSTFRLYLRITSEERAAAAKDVIGRYCTDCHNDAERTAELSLERLALTDVGAHADVWEAVVRKLRGRMMPPAGEPLPDAAVADELVAYQRVCREALAHVTPLVRPGASCAELHRESDALIADAGYSTLLTKEPGTVLENGYFHSLGHGVGLEIHEPPSLGPNGEDLVAGDVVTLEPGIYRQGFGGCRLEDLVLVTEDGHEVLTDFPYDL